MTRTRLLIILVLLFWATCAHAQNLIFVPTCAGSDDTAKFTAIIATIGSNAGTIRLPYRPTSRCASNDLTIPSNITLDNTDGTGIKINTGKTLTVVGPIVNPPGKQFFYNALSGQGTVSFAGNASIGEVYPDWWAKNTTPGTTNMGSALNAALTASRTLALVPRSTYAYSSTLNLNYQNLLLHGNGATLKFTGTGKAVAIDYGGSGNSGQGVSMQDLLIKGNASATYGLYLNGVFRSTFKNLRVVDAVIGLGGGFAVLNSFENVRVTVNEGDSSFASTTGFDLNTVSSLGWSYNTFNNCFAEGVTGTGTMVTGGMGNVWTGGTDEANNRGMQFVTSNFNTVLNRDFEANSTEDYLVTSGQENQFINVQSGSLAHLAGGKRTRILGGTFATITIDVGATDTVLDSLTYNTALTNNSTTTNKLFVKVGNTTYDGNLFQQSIQIIGGNPQLILTAAGAAALNLDSGSATQGRVVRFLDSGTNYRMSFGSVGFSNRLGFFSGDALNGGTEVASVDTTGKGIFASTAIGAGATITSSGPGGALTASAFAATGQLPGTATNDSATAGNVGELISSSVAAASAVSLTTVTAANVTSISLTAGDWDMWGDVNFLSGAATTITTLSGSMSTTSVTADFTPGRFGNLNYPAGTVFGVSNTTAKAGPVRVSLAAPSTVYLVAYSSFGVDTLKAWGILNARRVR